MQYMFASCTKLTSLDIRTFETSTCKNFTNMFENDQNLDLYYNMQTCSNMKETLPPYINGHDTSEN